MAMRILIIKLASLGDVLRTTSILLPLNKRYPEASISWITSTPATDLLLNNPYLKSVYSVEEFKKLANAKYDIVISLDEEETCARIASDIGGDIRGFYFTDGKVLPTKSAKEWFDMGALGEKPTNDILKKRNTKTYQQHILNIIGFHSEDLSVSDYPLIYELTDAEKAITEEFKNTNGISSNDIVLGMNTGAGGRWEHKKWSQDKTCELILRLSKLPVVKVVLFGGPEEKLRNREIVRAVGTDVIDAGVDNTIRHFGALVNSCDILLTSDSLAMHIGIALKKYVVVFFGPTSYAEIELYGNGRKIVPDIGCSVCYKQKCDFENTCMDTISVDMTYEAIVEGVEKLKNYRR